MSRQVPAGLGLRTGLIILALVGLGLGLVVWRSDSAPPLPTIFQTADDIDLASAFEDEVSAAYLQSFETLAPDWADRLDETLAASIAAGQSPQQLRGHVLTASLAAIHAEGPYLRYGSVEQYDQLIASFGRGLSDLKANGSSWCTGPKVEAFLRGRETALMSSLIETVSQSPDAYVWALGWSTQILRYSAAAKARPFQHGPRTARDKALLQQTGLSLGADYWTLALQIAAFSKAEGQDYGSMRTVIEGLDVCEMGLAMVEMSNGLPTGPRGRIWAQLLPEIFAGNTPYVVYVMNDYFFLDAP